MTVATLLLASAFVAFPDLSAREVSIQALIALPELGARDQALLRRIAHAIPYGSTDYGRKDILAVTSGQPVRCVVMPDHLRIIISVQPANLNAGLGLAQSLLSRAALRAEHLQLLGEKRNYWNYALEPWKHQDSVPKAGEIGLLYQRVFRPERTTLAVGGPVVPAQAQAEWERRLRSWKMPPEPKGYFDILERDPLTVNPAGITTVDIAWQAPTRGPLLADTVLALIALGSGKGSSLFRVIRNTYFLSYRQEAVLWPTLGGFDARLVIAVDVAGNPPLDAIANVLAGDVAKWTEAERLRALGMAEAILLRGNAFGPFAFSSDEPLGSSLEDRTFMAGYWKMKTGSDWDADRLLGEMRDVQLGELRAVAYAIVRGKATVLKGK